MAERDYLPAIDAAKAIGISLVVLGHSPGLPREAVNLIFSFHMPLFFFLSGLLHPPASSHARAGEMLARRARALLVPYLFFFALSLAYWLATRHLGDRAAKFEGVSVADALMGLVTGRSSDLFVNPTLWFLPCLFVCTVLYVPLRRRLPAPAVMVVAATVAALWTAFDGWRVRPPWGLDIAWVALVFYAAGDAVRGTRWATGRPSGAALALLPLAALAWLLAALQLGRVDLAQANFGGTFGLYLLTAFLGIAMVMLASRLLPPHPVLRWLSAHTLIIFPLHSLLINFASGALKYLQLGGDWTANHGWAFVFFGWAMLGCLPAAALLTRRLPWLLGRGRGRPVLSGARP